MKLNVRKFVRALVGLGFMTAAVLTVFYLFKIIVAITLAMVAGALAGVLVISLALAIERHKDEIKAAAQTVMAALKPDPVLELEETLRALLRLNLLLRVTPGIESALIGLAEKIIDELKQALPALLKDYPGETLTYEVRRIAKDHFPKIIAQFIDLSPAGRLGQTVVLEKSLADMLVVCQRSREIVEKNEIGEFSSTANFLKAKYAESAI